MNWEALLEEMDSIPTEDFRERWQVLGRHRFLAPLAGVEGLEEVCTRLERLAYELDSLGIFISIISGCGLAVPIIAGSNHPDASEHVKRILCGDSITAVAITERGAGSDVFGMKTVVEQRDGALRLRGSKWSITNAPVADQVIVFCQNETTDQRFLSALLVPTDAEGVRVLPAQPLAGAQGSPTGEIIFDDVRIEPDWLLGAPDEGKLLLDLAFTRERLLAPWPLIGKMSRVLQESVDYVREREQFGQRIGDFQYVQEKIVTAYEELETTRLLASEALRRYLSSESAQLHASLAKYHAAERAARVFKAMIEVRGSYGVQTESGLTQHLIDALCASIAGGTREVHKKVVFDQLVLDRTRSRRRGASRLFRCSHTVERST